MKKYIPTFTDISKWHIQVYTNTGGSRSKKIAINPQTEEEYFFKGSKITKDGEIRYPMEFWSEIISSKIGQYLGFPMLDYNIAFHIDQKQQVGCISKSMVRYSENRLTEGKEFLTGYNSKYNPKKDKTEYTFQFICNSLKYFELDNYINKIIEIIIFDSIISNSDRHQENWGIIHKYKETYEAIDTEIKEENLGLIKRFLLEFIKNFLQSIDDLKSKSKSKYVKKGLLQIDSSVILHEFSPIYDSGCCLGREIEEYEIQNYLDNSKSINSYIQKGVSEIHWQGIAKKRTHFELIELLKENHETHVRKIIERVLNTYNESNIQEIIYNIDNNIPENLLAYKLTQNRKDLMLKLITLRLEKLKQLV